MRLRWYDWGVLAIVVDVLLLAVFWFAFIRSDSFRGPVFGRVDIRSIVNAHQASVVASVGDQIKSGTFSDSSVNNAIHLSKEFYQRLTSAMSNVASQNRVILLNSDAVLAMPNGDAVVLRDYTEDVNALLTQK
jgi:hypothetical protein